MSDQSSPQTGPKWNEAFMLILGVANLLVVTIGGYFFVGQFQAGNDKAQAILASTQNKIVEQQLRFFEDSQNASMRRTKIESSLSLLKIVQDLRPSIELYLDENVEVVGQRVISLTFVPKNTSNYPVVVHPRKLILSKEPYTSFDHKEEDIIPFETVTDNSSSLLPPGRTIGHAYILSLPKGAPEVFYYVASYDSKALNEIRHLAEQLSKEIGIELDPGLFEFESTSYGSITLSHPLPR